MAELIIQSNKIKENIRRLSDFFESQHIEWSLVTKVFSGDKTFLEKILTDDVIAKINSVGDSRLSSLKNLRAVRPDLKTIYIKPPAQVYANEVIKYADISLNTSFSTIKALDDAARAANTTHKIIVMIELGELREGIKRDDILDFYEKIFNLKSIEVIGIGSNLGCMYGIEPTYDKLMQLCLYKELISAKFNKKLRLISGGSSITLPLIQRGEIPKEVNHFRIGETAFFGISPLNNLRYNELHTDTFDFYANIIELEEKNTVPDGIISDANIGLTADYKSKTSNETSYKAILDFGLLDVDKSNLEAYDENISFVGVTSDMLVIDIGSNKEKSGKPRYKVGDKIRFKPNYMAVARLLNSKFIDKIYEE
ncbi:MAG: alanine racemase [Flavobacteriaceae bacterium]|nr:alanine racemase [Mangrovimonas sp.]MCB0432166.1 alanine racemase [Mangrovimonas sp.]MCB0435662.1 alanine racemase [Mangrovimonas sp.]MCB0469441.1 alanine racemase [Flavobacteriaceae bacterium]HPF98101.1 alanine racemase [Mangrovimonas sp.]